MGAYGRVIVGLDLVEATAPLLLTRACQVADRAAIEAVHVCDHLHYGHTDYGTEPAFRNSEELDDAVKRSALNYLNGVTEPFDILRRAVLGGQPARVLHEHASDGAELIVVGTHGRHGWRTLLGSTANAVVHGTPCSVLAVRIPEGEPVVPGPYRRVLVAVNLGEESNEVLRHARRIVDGSDGQISLGHVMTAVANADHRREVERRLEALAHRFDVDPAAIHVLEGRPAAQIHALAEELDADLVAVGTHGKQGLELITGSTANAVLHGATCDILSVRIPPPGSATPG
jgi:universal stress protein A